MKKTLLLFSIVCTSTYMNAQAPLTWLDPVIVNSTLGFDWPRVAVSNSTPIIVWGDFSSGVLLYRRLVSGTFEPEVQLTPGSLTANVFALTGPDMKASGDTVYVTYVDVIEGHAYMQRSFNQGLTFSDTVRIDNIGDNYAQYPSVDIMPGGDPIVAFAKLNSGFSNPQYVVTKSSDGGSSFSADVSATDSLGADPCDCCPGSIVYHDGVVAVIYRNAINDLRDMRAAISHDGGNTFNEVASIDNHNWIIANCPSTGGQGVIEGDTLISVFMNGVNGNQCFLSAFNLNDFQLSFEKPLFNLPGGGTQNHPRIAASGDTMAVVWEQIIDGHRNIMFTYSLTGASGLGIVVDTISNVLPNGYHTDPDIAYSHGTFYIVFGDEVAEKIYLMEGILYETSGIQTPSSDDLSIQVAGNLQGDAITISSNQILNESFMVSVHNANGGLCERHNLLRLETSQSLKLDQGLASGIYLLSIAAKDISVSFKWVIAR
ncbi:MAG TPA: hypothetical protein VE978_21735 [Chitinophagales bacterium]|nr:hypothetical protein [Chitinophagales bacterium]